MSIRQEWGKKVPIMGLIMAIIAKLAYPNRYSLVPSVIGMLGHISRCHNKAQLKEAV